MPVAFPAAPFVAGGADGTAIGGAALALVAVFFAFAALASCWPSTPATPGSELVTESASPSALLVVVQPTSFWP